ncbi:MAG TPA: glycoside hydrolase family 2 TIM barrel-domain containing protein [Bacteroidales bacterium]|nr:glycoside hydrolase family 2 TIM barrel-domain containing protein [Bacteroidales bacterium]HPF02373.1 glycoside hydrolase family 2 TIM barrel-domain containing protein [Bacteroidales bacterium]HPJ58944.1 glycoside hydrolase family 2 TIM barrel-domain containing protein [Bacteroidales bacterium]HPR12198.1 glycoside hydrolase family 2 TIM barrel-domain containing protein [Bacteroidales bacterium]HRW84881.1 glycoside hydrolase family 2 TIM barrel-domain containing protein [Bacteroidales bacteri
MKIRSLIFLLTFVAVISAVSSCGKTSKKEDTKHAEIWSVEKAQEWYTIQGWLRGCNFIPSTAINQLEMWQSETFDPVTIDIELGWAEEIGMNCMRVYLHHLAWETDREGFKRRMDEYLRIATSHGIKTIFVFFDDCWNPTYKAGRQPDPEPGIHNSGWVRDPGDLLFTNPEIISVLGEYVRDILNTFGNDERIVLWDLYNEPGNSGYGDKSLPLLEKVFQWSREADLSQPVSAGVWRNDLAALNRFQLDNSDVITYHNYKDPENHQVMIDSLRKYNRPLICTEYMARKHNSLFTNIMPLLKDQNIGAINWGLVSGKTNTIYAWDTPIPDGSEPELWFHDIFRKDGTAYRGDELQVILDLTGTNKRL